MSKQQKNEEYRALSSQRNIGKQTAKKMTLFFFPLTVSCVSVCVRVRVLLQRKTVTTAGGREVGGAAENTKVKTTVSLHDPFLCGRDSHLEGKNLHRYVSSCGFPPEKRPAEQGTHHSTHQRVENSHCSREYC